MLFLAMRFVAGDDLRTIVERDGPLAPERAAAVVAQVAAALGAAHARGLVHRDVKPANVLVTADDHCYLTDFGLVKDLAATAGVTRTGEVLGTLDYVAPERIQGGETGPWTDVYALGCVLFFALTGSVVFPLDAPESKLWAHVSEPPPVGVRRSRPAIPPALDEVVADGAGQGPARALRERAGARRRRPQAAASARRPAGGPRRRARRGGPALRAAPPDATSDRLVPRPPAASRSRRSTCTTRSTSCLRSRSSAGSPRCAGSRSPARPSSSTRSRSSSPASAAAVARLDALPRAAWSDASSTTSRRDAACDGSTSWRPVERDARSPHRSTPAELKARLRGRAPRHAVPRSSSTAPGSRCCTSWRARQPVTIGRGADCDVGLGLGPRGLARCTRSSSPWARTGCSSTTACRATARSSTASASSAAGVLRDGDRLVLRRDARRSTARRADAGRELDDRRHDQPRGGPPHPHAAADPRRAVPARSATRPSPPRSTNRRSPTRSHSASTRSRRTCGRCSSASGSRTCRRTRSAPAWPRSRCCRASSRSATSRRDQCGIGRRSPPWLADGPTLSGLRCRDVACASPPGGGRLANPPPWPMSRLTRKRRRAFIESYEFPLGPEEQAAREARQRAPGRGRPRGPARVVPGLPRTPAARRSACRRGPSTSRGTR